MGSATGAAELEKVMNAATIKTMNSEQCNEAIVKIELKARVDGKVVSAANQKVIKLLEQRIDELDPDRED